MGQLAPVSAQSFATVTEPQKISELLRAIDAYSGLQNQFDLEDREILPTEPRYLS